MFKIGRAKKNYLNGNDLIVKGMYKRRRLAGAAIAKICDTKEKIRLVK